MLSQTERDDARKKVVNFLAEYYHDEPLVQQTVFDAERFENYDFIDKLMESTICELERIRKVAK